MFLFCYSDQPDGSPTSRSGGWGPVFRDRGMRTMGRSAHFGGKVRCLDFKSRRAYVDQFLVRGTVNPSVTGHAGAARAGYRFRAGAKVAVWPETKGAGRVNLRRRRRLQRLLVCLVEAMTLVGTRERPGWARSSVGFADGTPS